MAERNEDARSVFCGNIPEKVTEELLYELFLQAGPVESVHIPKNPDGKPKGFGFICFKHEESVPYTITLMEGITLFGSRLSIKPRTGNELPVNHYSHLLRHHRTRSCPETNYNRNRHNNRDHGMYESRQTRNNEEQLRMANLSRQAMSRNMVAWSPNVPPIQMWSTFSQSIVQPGMTPPHMMNQQFINQAFTQFNPEAMQFGYQRYTDFSTPNQGAPHHNGRRSRDRKHSHTPYR